VQSPELKPQQAPVQLSTPPVAATALQEAVGLTLPVQVATALRVESERELRALPESAQYSPAATHRLPAERQRDQLKQAAPAQEAPALTKLRLQDSPRRRCRTANRQLRARALRTNQCWCGSGHEHS